MTRLFCATTNPGKVKEFQHAADELAPGLFHFDLLPGLRDIAPPVEDGSTFEENAVLKALYYSQHAPDMVFADDSGLSVDALGGAPGVHSARFSGPEATDESNNRLLLEKLQGVSNRSARYVCVIALAREGSLLGTFEGTVAGEILDQERGSEGFGYDPMFYYPPFQETFGQSPKEKKLGVSHRGEAFRKMLAFLKRQQKEKARGVNVPLASNLVDPS